MIKYLVRLTPALFIAALFTACNTATTTNEPAENWEADLKHRLLVDFNKTREEVKEYITQYIPDVTDAQMDVWEAHRAIEAMEIDGKTRYFHAAARNLFRIDPTCRAIMAKQTGAKALGGRFGISPYLKGIANDAEGPYALAAPRRMRVTYTLTVRPDEVPAGETIRCWLPLPRTDVPRQKDFTLISTSESDYTIAPDSAIHRTLYMEKKAEAGQPTVFSEVFEYTSMGAKFHIAPEDVQPYDTTSALYKEYTSERDTHIKFSPRLRELAARLTAGETNPLIMARKIFEYIDANFPWASAREYSTIENIPEYVVDNRHGDCGQKTLLFITLCRIVGIPAHFQSGFYMEPDEDNMHDWSEIYFEGIGWVPVDQSFGVLHEVDDEEDHFFYLGGMDSWRMIVNQDYSAPLFPAKKFARSETVDFQRGEVEWKGGNLYFDQWRWNMDIEYLE